MNINIMSGQGSECVMWVVKIFKELYSVKRCSYYVLLILLSTYQYSITYNYRQEYVLLVSSSLAS